MVIFVACAVVYALSIWAVIVTVRDLRTAVLLKIAWTLALLLLPPLGLLAWTLARVSTRQRRRPPT
ncbi:MAG: PLDc N-terminal domain-containing protein [Microbacterium enclense]